MCRALVLVLVLVRWAIKWIAAAWVMTGPASCTEGINRSCNKEFAPFEEFVLFKLSSKHISTICLSVTMPSARNTMNSGTGLRTLGIFTTIFMFEYLPLGATRSTLKVRTGLDVFSDTLLISVVYKTESESTLVTRNMLSPKVS